MVAFTRLLIICLLASYLSPQQVLAIANPAEYTNLSESTKKKAKEKIADVLTRYCGQFCQLIDVQVSIDEQIPDGDDMGFESTVNQSAKADLIITALKASIQVDERIGVVNQTRLENILKVHLGSLALKSEVQWNPVKLPRITRYAEGEPGFLIDAPTNGDYPEGEWDFRPQDYSGKAQQLREKLDRKIKSTLNNIIAKYCPNQCIIEQIDIMGAMIDPRSAVKLPRNQQLRSDSGRSIFQIDSIDVDITMDEKLTEDERNRITALMRSKLRFASPINLNIGIIDFPESYADIQAKNRSNTNDPYGLEKLRKMLIMFRDLAGTKEIINTNTTETQSSTDKQSDTRSNESEKRRDLSSLEANSAWDTDELVFTIGALILLVGLVIYGIMKARQSNRDALDMMVMANPQEKTEGEENRSGDSKSKDEITAEKREDLSLQLKIDEIKDELIDLFIENPKVAKETFSRFLKEDGVEDTAKYVHVFGHLIVFELLKDPNFKRELYELSEYYHNSDFEFERSEEYELLLKLKTRVTASEIRVLTRKSSEKFDFLAKLDSSQVFQLIKEEKVQVQAIVLTQLDRKKRQAVFDLYMGEPKVQLMNELSTAETIPKEFLFNVAKVLQRKVISKPEFDTENLRTSDILLDLMEKAALEEQKTLMTTLQKNNAETARSLKAKLVTIYMLPYLKGGHLLELILSMDREDLLVFLSSTHDDIRNLILQKAPEELSDSWIEEMETFNSPDEQTFRLVEMKLLNKIRSLANNGVISLLDINSLIFEESTSEFETQTEEPPTLNNSFGAA